MNSVKKKTYLASIAVATPPYIANQTKAEKFLIKYYSNKLNARNKTILHKIFSHPSIKQRRFAIKNLGCLLNEDPDERISRFTHWAIELSAEAAIKAMNKVDIKMSDVSGLVVNTCTGYICPGISTFLIEKLGLPPQIQAFDLVGSGCGGAIPNLQMADLMMRDKSKGIVLSISVEICSATFQMDDDPSLIVSNAIFADGASAVALWSRPEGFEMVSSSNFYATEHRDAIRYIYKNGQLHNHLSVRLPRLVKEAAAKAVRSLLKTSSLRVEDIKHWAIHTGGEKIIDAIKNEIGLSENQLQATRRVLAEYGNMSSPTVWFVARELLRNGIESGDLCLLVTFGAGLSAHAFLLRKM